MEGKMKAVSRKVVYGLDVEINFCWRDSRKTQKRKKVKNGIKLEIRMVRTEHLKIFFDNLIVLSDIRF